MEHFFLSTDLHSNAHQSQIFGRDADEGILKLLGGIQSNYWGGYIPPSSLVSAPLSLTVSLNKGPLALRHLVNLV